MSATETTTYTPQRGVSLTITILLMVVSLLSGVVITLFVQLLFKPPPQALVAQVGSGTSMTVPATCAANDQIYQVAVNGGEGMRVMAGKLTSGDLVVTATAKFTESGTADAVVVEARARDAKTAQPIVMAIYAWTAPANTTPGSQAA